MNVLRHAHEVSAYMDSLPDPAIAALIKSRLAELINDDIPNMEELLCFVIPQIADGLSALEEALSAPVMSPEGHPLWEVIEDHGSLFEMVFVLSSSGYGALVLAEKCQCHPDLLALCQQHAVPSQEST
jgi:hypothetical protein